ncbi:hypothetical protein [Methylorubrum podarium]|jgi:hypothetical protein|uniref:hypothetical protein n=1 Tax=Methylorubrum podarium TaxID=200476 RepID=UPI001EE29B97|nr:hypothetical protein [Methylorubrum podarium]MDV2987692.1 hypothetical protein [Methylobacteriaceae bacterium AG10]GJE72362.1 hypothetical protein CHKEEEPN_3917 [Methylorubrum podarium]
MKPFITSQPESERTRLDSAFDPVLSGVARGLARLFPPVQNVRTPREDGAAASRRSDTGSGRSGRG